jgi:competence protein ComGC
MKTRIVLFVMAIMFFLAQPGFAGVKDHIQNYFNDTACNVKATADPIQKRVILDNSLQTMSKALEKVESSGLVTQADRAGLDRFKTTLQEKQEELAGLNGFEPVPDAQLDNFADYVVQDMEQAEQYITVSLVAILLIIIILILIV